MEASSPIWQQRWRNFRSLEQRWPNYSQEILHSILVDTDISEPIKRSKEDPHARCLIDEAMATRAWSFDVCNDSPGIFEDVYHAAIVWRLFHDWTMGKSPSDRGEKWLYRGENKDFAQTTTSLHRITDDDDLAHAVERLERFVDAASVLWPWLEEPQLIALAQHYGGDPGVQLQTWLLDVTWDPYVALFFASYGWEAPAANKEDWEEIGRVSAIHFDEWQSLTAGIGTLEALRVPGFSRIRHQRALFLNVPDARLVDSCSPLRVRFYQKQGLVFTDREMSISEDFLLTRDVQRNIAGWEGVAGPGVIVPRLISPPRKKPETPRFDKIAETMAKNTGHFTDVADTSKRDEVIRLLGRVHHRMYFDAQISHDSLFFLQESVQSAIFRLTDDQELQMSDLLESYRLKALPADRDRVMFWIRAADNCWKNHDRSHWGSHRGCQLFGVLNGP